MNRFSVIIGDIQTLRGIGKAGRDAIRVASPLMDYIIHRCGSGELR